MKILDLLEKQIDTMMSPDKRYKRSLVPRRSIDGKSNYGTFARVSADKKDPHMVVKNDTRPVGSPDNYNKFINELIKRDMINDNIHFPRVYNIQRIVDRNKKFIFKYQMEKLHSMSSLSIDEMVALIEQVTGTAPDESARVSLNSNEQLVVNRLSYSIDDALTGQKDKRDGRVVQESLVEAIEIIKQIEADLNITANDIGGDNILIRRTPVGCQLVITDPFYG